MRHICLRCYNNHGIINYCEDVCDKCGNNSVFIKDTAKFLNDFDIERGDAMNVSSAETDKLYEALAKAQGKFKTVTYNKEVRIKTRDGREYGYKYATLAAIMEMIREPLSENGLSVSQPIQDEYIITILGHASGQFISSTLKLSSYDDIKSLGANITYLRRYALSALLGVTVDEEDDENVADGKMTPASIYAPPQRQPQQPPQRQPQQPPPPPPVQQPQPSFPTQDTGEIVIETSLLSPHTIGEVKQTLLGLGYGTSNAQVNVVKKLFGDAADITSLTPIQQYNLFEYAKRSQMLDNTSYTIEQRLAAIPEVKDSQTPITTITDAKEFLVKCVHMLTTMEKPLRPFSI